MTLSDWIISISAGVIATLIALTSYFAQKWIESVDETVKELGKDIKDLTTQVSALKQSQGDQTKNLSEAVQSKLNAIKIGYEKIDAFGEKVIQLESVVRGKLLPAAEKLDENLGRVTLLESNQLAHNEKLITMFNVVKVLTKKITPDQTPAPVPKSGKAKA